MIARLAILFVGFLVFGAFLNLFVIVSSMLFAVALGIRNEAFYQVQYWVCFAVAAVISAVLMSRVWPTDRPRKSAARDDAASEHNSHAEE